MWHIPSLIVSGGIIWSLRLECEGSQFKKYIVACPIKHVFQLPPDAIEGAALLECSSQPSCIVKEVPGTQENRLAGRWP